MITWLEKILSVLTPNQPKPTQQLQVNEVYSMLFEASPLPQAIVSLLGVHLDANEAYCNLNEIAKHDLIGKTPTQIGYTTEEEVRNVSIAFEQANYKFDGYLVRYPTRNGRLLYLKVFAHRILWKGEVAISIVFHNVTEQRLAEKAVRESALAVKNGEALFKGVVQNLSGIVYILDMNGVFQLSEGLGLSLLGLVPGQVVGVSALEMFAENTLIVNALHRALKGEELVNETPVENLHFSNRYTPIYNEHGEQNGLLGVSFDITERKRMEEELGRLNKDLEQRVSLRTEQLQQANQDLDAFAHSVSHDLRTPIRHIEGFSKLMYGAITNPSETITQHYQRIIDSTKRTSSMVDDLLSFARLGKKAITKSTVDLDLLIPKVIKNLEMNFHEAHVEWNIKPLGIIQADANLLLLAFENLLSNSLKYSSKRSVIKIEIGSTEYNGEIEIYFKDNGVGFDMNYAEKLFGVFHRLHSDEEFEGTGIGLANVRQIVTKHGGTVRAEGIVDGGAIFYTKFPLY